MRNKIKASGILCPLALSIVLILKVGYSAMISGAFLFPIEATNAAGEPAIATMLVDAADETAAFIFYIPKNGTISKVSFRTTGVSTGANATVALETVNLSSGDPSGSLLGADSQAIYRLIADTHNNTYHTVSLNQPVNVTGLAGSVAALTIKNPGSDYGNFTVSRVSAYFGGLHPYTALYTTSWARGVSQGLGGLEYSDGSTPFVTGLSSIAQQGKDTVRSNLDPDEIGNVIIPPFTMNVSGAYLALKCDTNFGFIKILNATNVVLSNTTVNIGVRQSNNHGPYRVGWPTITLNQGETYRFIIFTNQTTETMTWQYYAYPDEIIKNQSSEFGDFMYATQRTDEGAWVDNKTKVYIGSLLVTGVNTTSGGGNGTIYYGDYKFNGGFDQ